MQGALVVPADHEHIEWACARSFARSSLEARHAYVTDGPSHVCEAWQFPLVNSVFNGGSFQEEWQSNDVTFVYVEGSFGEPSNPRVELICTATGLFQRLPMYRLRDTKYFIVTLRIPRNRSHRYQFLVHGMPRLDPVNPQREMTVAGQEWSRFFTWGYNQPVTFEPWELCILDRLTRHILPFNNAEARNFLRRVSGDQVAHLYRLDDSVGVSNYIDKLVAREERQHLYTYHTCLDLIDKVLRKRNPYADPERMPEAMYLDLYTHLTESQPHYRDMLVNDGWDLGRYRDPKHFLGVLRRHTWTGAFSHPKYGGNAGGTAWAYLSERYAGNGKTLFDWPRVTERPLGAAVDEYRA